MCFISFDNLFCQTNNRKSKATVCTVVYCVCTVSDSLVAVEVCLLELFNCLPLADYCVTAQTFCICVFSVLCGGLSKVVCWSYLT